MPLGLIALALGGFGIGLTEFVIVGLLPEVAADFGVTEATAGWLISGYALAVVVGALGLTAAATRSPASPCSSPCSCCSSRQRDLRARPDATR